MCRLSQMLYITTGGFISSFLTAGCLLVIGAVLILFLKTGWEKEPAYSASLEVQPVSVQS